MKVEARTATDMSLQALRREAYKFAGLPDAVVVAMLEADTHATAQHNESEMDMSAHGQINPARHSW